MRLLSGDHLVNELTKAIFKCFLAIEMAVVAGDIAASATMAGLRMMMPFIQVGSATRSQKRSGWLRTSSAEPSWALAVLAVARDRHFTSQRSERCRRAAAPVSNQRPWVKITRTGFSATKRRPAALAASPFALTIVRR